MLDMKIPYRLSSQVVELVNDNGAVTGAVIEANGQRLRIAARLGVVLAAGGFPQNIALRRAHFDHLADRDHHVSLAPETNTGDGIELGSAAGACISSKLSAAAPWAPVSIIQRPDGSTESPRFSRRPFG
ncbi:FAD-binding protein [Castellaniella sp. GW247-6E4]|uniref:FAD-binding protein n=1 Tax=Castellaniella sp. GW247-6E4 TaxID=3140380 RepID=UPI0033151951